MFAASCALYARAPELPEFDDELRQQFRSAHEPQRYLTRRGFTLAFAQRWGVGWAPPSSYSEYRGRLLLPIRDLTGNLLAYSGRLLEGATGRAKYWHGSFPKQRVLFGLYESNMLLAPSRRLYLVEGGLDALALQQFGCHAAAYMSAAPSAWQIAQAVSLYSEVVLWADNDEAGAQARKRLHQHTSPLRSALVGVMGATRYKDAAECLQKKRLGSVIEQQIVWDWQV